MNLWEVHYFDKNGKNPHLIRHTTATSALERGMDVTELQKMLGHEKLDTTMIYAKVSQESLKIGRASCRERV